MSKNFELMMEIEKDLAGPPPEPCVSPDRTRIFAPSLTALDVSDVDHEVDRLVRRVFFPASGAGHRHIVFCGIEAANPSSSVCARTARNLAAHTHERVCLVDANPCPSGLTRLFGIHENAAGDAVESGQCLPVGGNLWLTRYSAANRGGERSLSELRATLPKLHQDFGYVLIDAPGCAANDDAPLLGQVSDAVILVIEAEVTHRQAAGKAKQNLEAAGVRLAGTVLHNRTFPVPRTLYERL